MELGPSRASRAAASARVNPSAELSSQASTSAAEAEDTPAAVSACAVTGDADMATVLTLFGAVRVGRCRCAWRAPRAGRSAAYREVVSSALNAPVSAGRLKTS